VNKYEIYEVGDLVQVTGLLGLIVQKNNTILFSREDKWYLIDFLSESEFERRLVHENDLNLLTTKSY
jgi:hypothetical protein